MDPINRGWTRLVQTFQPPVPSWAKPRGSILGVALLLGVSAISACVTSPLSVEECRDFLRDRDIPAANECFGQIVALEPDNQPANAFYSVTRILVFLYREDVHDLLDRLGVTAEGRDPYDWGASFILNPEGELQLPPNAPSPEEIQTFLYDHLRPEILGALGNLAAIIDEGFQGWLHPDEILSDDDVEVDLGDVRLYQALLHAALAAIKMGNAYDVGLDLYAVLTRFYAGLLDPDLDLVQAYPSLATLVRPGMFPEARADLLTAIDFYFQASAFIRSEADPQHDDLIHIDPEDLPGELHFRNILLEIQASLSGDEPGPFSLALNQVFSLHALFENPIDLRSLIHGNGLRDSLMSHLLPQVERALLNLQGADTSFVSFVLPEDFPVDRVVKVDYGELAVLMAALEAAEGFLRFTDVYDLDIEFAPLIARLYAGEEIRIQQDILDPNPNLLALHDTGQLPSIRAQIVDAIDQYVQASEFIRFGRPSQEDNLIVIEDDEDGPFRDLLADLRRSVLGEPVDFGPWLELNRSLVVDLSRLFVAPLDNTLFPQFGDSNAVFFGSFPDPTFNGLLPGMTQAELCAMVPCIPSGLKRKVDLTPIYLLLLD